jgi:hypothetical protein
MMPEPTVTTDRWLLSGTYRKPFTEGVPILVEK